MRTRRTPHAGGAPVPRHLTVVRDAQPEPDRPASFGWRPGIGVNHADPQRPGWENPRAVWAATAFGPCTKCTARTRRYGPGGNPLCPACRGTATSTTSTTTVPTTTGDQQ